MVIQVLDKLILLGDDEKIARFNKKYVKHLPKKTEDNDILENFSLNTVVIDENSSLLGKTIRQFHSTKKHPQIVVGLEHKGIRQLNPSLSTKLKTSDILFIVEEKQH